MSRGWKATQKREGSCRRTEANILLHVSGLRGGIDIFIPRCFSPLTHAHDPFYLYSFDNSGIVAGVGMRRQGFELMGGAQDHRADPTSDSVALKWCISPPIRKVSQNLAIGSWKGACEEVSCIPMVSLPSINVSITNYILCILNVVVTLLSVPSGE